MKRPKLKVSAKAKAWQAANPWFGEDAAATRLAFDFHCALLEQGVKSDTDEYYEQLDAKMRLARELGLLKGMA
jgi:hypothetical protein